MNTFHVQRAIKHYSRLLIVVIASAVLGGCGAATVKDEASLLAAIPAVKLERAAALESQGQAADAAALYLNLAAKTSPPAQTQLQLKAARASLAAGQLDAAQQVLNTLAAQKLPAAQQALRQLTQAELALLNDRPQEAIALLKRTAVKALSPALQRQRLGILAAAQRQAHLPLAAARTLDVLEQSIDDRPARLLTQASLVATLNLLDTATLRAVQRKSSARLRGWTEIALLTRQAGADAATLHRSYRAWQQTHPRHGALPGLARAYTALWSGGYQAGEQVTVMLPRSGRFAAAAKAIKAGIVAAHLADAPEQRPVLTFIDGSQEDRLVAIHARAIADGVDYVLGPLQKEAVAELTRGGRVPVPTLALNEATAPTQRADNLFQFALSPENEAAEVANHAYAQGWRRAVVLFPNDAWGERLALAFQQRWQALGGALSGKASYPPDTPTAAPFKQLLSDGRAEMVFLVATAETVRQLYPPLHQMQPKLAVLSTSHVYTGNFDSVRDGLLDGLYFVDIPWMLAEDSAQPLARRQLTSGADPLARLYAMGIDAYRLAPRVPTLATNPGGYYPGQTGGLAVDQVGRIQRQLVVGRFTSAGVVELALGALD
ncbi:hypothetical protein CKO12_12940 [Chromatium okenii]|uniref:penicillin-binding protein activator n=1 Tax=Chromatium okenii TaxID=61644 RepID=UPI001908566A|nr:penicillin-binding protein activator [Chromatium okenii]MBK1642758.1 hypothetical protein [Chromatium okenii]